MDHPGRVFYIDGSGTRFELTDLAGKLKIESGDVAPFSSSRSGRISASLTANILTLGGLLNFSPGASASRDYAGSISVGTATQYQSDEKSTRSALKTIDPTLLNKSSRYFIIRDTRVANRETLVFDRGIDADFGGRANFTAKFKGLPSGSGSAKLSYADSQSYKIDVTFRSPMTVCYLAQRFDARLAPFGAAGGPNDVELLDEYWQPHSVSP